MQAIEMNAPGHTIGARGRASTDDLGPGQRCIGVLAERVSMQCKDLRVRGGMLFLWRW